MRADGPWRQDAGSLGFVDQFDALICGKMGSEPTRHHIDHRGVRDTTDLRLRDHREDHVIDDVSCLVAEMRVTTSTDGNGRHRLGGKALQPRCNAFSKEPEAPHVGDVEQPRPSASGMMLL